MVQLEKISNEENGLLVMLCPFSSSVIDENNRLKLVAPVGVEFVGCPLWGTKHTFYNVVDVSPIYEGFFIEADGNIRFPNWQDRRFYPGTNLVLRGILLSL